MFHVPQEPLWETFTPEVLERLRRVRAPTDQLDFRLQVLASGGLNPNYPNRTLRAYKSAWEVYLVAAFACGLFQGEHGSDLLARLRGVDDEGFRSALSECLAAWYLAGPRKFLVEPRPEGRSGHPLEFALKICDGDIKVEVKAPYRALTSSFFWGDDSDALESALREANDQFASGDRNLLVIVPRLRLPLFDAGYRRPIERAFIGETLIQIPIDMRTGGPAGPDRVVFKESGRFAKHWPAPSDTAHWKPRFTRVSAALFIGEYDDGREVKHRALIVHNPNAVAALPRDLWLGIPEFLFDGSRWRWSDMA